MSGIRSTQSVNIGSHLLLAIDSVLSVAAIKVPAIKSITLSAALLYRQVVRKGRSRVLPCVTRRSPWTPVPAPRDTPAQDSWFVLEKWERADVGGA